MIQPAKRMKKGFFSFFYGIPYIYRNKLGKYIILPCFVSFLVISLITVLFFWAADSLFATLTDSAISLGFIQTTIKFLKQWAGFLLWILEASRIMIEASLALFATILTYRIIIPVVILPFMGPLLNRIEKIELGEEILTSWKDDFYNILRSLYISLRSGVFGLLFLILGLCLGPFEILINIIYQSYTLGRSSFDTVFEKKFKHIRERDKKTQQWKWQVLGHGVAYFGFLLIPFFGVILAPVISLTGAAVFYFQNNKK